MQKSKVQESPIFLFSVLAISIFIIGSVVMYAITSVYHFSSLATILMDALFLVASLSPLLYFLVFRPLVMQIRERKKIEEALREAEERYRQLVMISPYPIAVHNGREILLANKAIASLYGIDDPSGMVGKPIMGFVHPSYKGVVQERVDQMLGEKKVAEILEEKFFLADGSCIDAEVAGMPIPYGENLAVQIVIRDITERKRAEEKIRSSLEEKEVLLREIHHRVKNNLQIISSLLHLQSQSVQDAQALGAFQKSQNRIQSIALIHEKLYHSEDLAQINFKDHISTLASYLFQAYQIDPQKIQLIVEAESLVLNIDLAIPCGLILNELISNSLKHGFPPGEKGEGDSSRVLFISFRKREEKWELVLRDNGPGLPKGFDLETTETLGLKLVRTLTSQLDGTLEFIGEQGVEFRIVFP